MDGKGEVTDWGHYPNWKFVTASEKEANGGNGCITNSESVRPLFFSVNVYIRAVFSVWVERLFHY